MSKKNLIMGVIKGYGWLDIEPFLISLKINCSEADCVLFYDDTAESTMAKVRDFNDCQGGVLS